MLSHYFSFYQAVLLTDLAVLIPLLLSVYLRVSLTGGHLGTLDMIQFYANLPYMNPF